MANFNLLHKLQEIHLDENNPTDTVNNNINSNLNPNVLQSFIKRSQTLLSLNLFKKSLSYSQTVLDLLTPLTLKLLPPDLDSIHLYAIDLKGKALLGLSEYEEAILFLGRESKSLKNGDFKVPSIAPSHKRHLQHWIYLQDRATVLQRESIRGDIKMGALIPNKRVRLEVDIIPEFQGDVQIGVDIPGKGRGVLALQDIPAGSLILATRAFEIIFDTEDDDDELENAIAARLRLDPDLIHDVYNLHAGTELGSIPPNKKNTYDIDLNRIAAICTMNSFGNSRNSSGYGHNSRGLWLRASFFNHDCIDFNAMWKVLGDFLFVRTLQDVKKGEELLISYTDTAEPYEEREKFFQAHDFSCICRLCDYQRKEDVKMRGRKLTLIKQLETLDEKDRKGMPLPEVEKDITFTLQSLAELESMSGSCHPEWNFSMHVALDLLTKLYLLTGNTDKYKDTAARYYFVVNCSGIKKNEQEKDDKFPPNSERGPCLEVGAAGQVAAVFLKAGDIAGAQKWISILKQDLALMYGKGGDVFPKLYPQLYAQAVKIKMIL